MICPTTKDFWINDDFENNISLYQFCKEQSDSMGVNELIEMLNMLKKMGLKNMAQSIADEITEGDGRSLSFKRRMTQKNNFHKAIFGQEETTVFNKKK